MPVEDPRDDPAHLIELLGLQPHPEGGHYVQTWQEGSAAGRSSGTAIYFLLRAGEESHWHRIDSAEVWHHYAGAPVVLRTWTEGRTVVTRRLGTDFAGGERPQLVVEPEEWQTARSDGAWTLVGNTVSPGFEFDRFELAEPGWQPPVEAVAR